jgi:predicted ArsR family transcriptional regulator
MATRQQQERIVERRAQVAALRLAGVRSCRQIARRLGASRMTVCRDLAFLDREWAERAAADVRVEKGRALDRYEALLRAFWGPALAGDAKAAGVVLACLAALARTLGTAAPLRVDLAARVRQVARAYGLDPDEAVEEAAAILREEGA